MGEYLVDGKVVLTAGFCSFPLTRSIKLDIHITHSELSWSSLGKARIL